MRIYNFRLLVGEPFIPLLMEVSGPSSQSIGFGSSFPRAIEDLDDKSGQEFGPADLTAAEVLRRRERLQVFMVQEHFDSLGLAFELRSPFLEASDDGDEFFVIDLVVSFGRAMLFQKVSHRVYGSIVVVVR